LFARHDKRGSCRTSYARCSKAASALWQGRGCPCHSGFCNHLSRPRRHYKTEKSVQLTSEDRNSSPEGVPTSSTICCYNYPYLLLQLVLLVPTTSTTCGNNYHYLLQQVVLLVASPFKCPKLAPCGRVRMTWCRSTTWRYRTMLCRTPDASKCRAAAAVSSA